MTVWHLSTDDGIYDTLLKLSEVLKLCLQYIFTATASPL